MPIPDHVRIVTRGSLPGGELWTGTLGLGTTDGPYAGLDLAKTCFDVMEAWAGTQTRFAWLASGVTIDQVLGYVYADGVNVEQAASTQSPITGSPSVRLPNQVALVVTLQTGTPGRRTRGRMYLPYLATTMGANGRIGQDECQGMANNIATFLEQINASEAMALRETLRPAVISQVGAGLRSPITSVRCGNVLDTQRRRRNGLGETYSSSSVDYAGL